MNRRVFLSTVASGSLVLTAGCTAVLEDPGSFDFGISNWRERDFTAELVLRKNETEALVDGRFDIAANNPDREDAPGIYLEDITQVRNGDTIGAQVTLDGETYRGTYEVTCNQVEDFDNDYFLRIYSGDPGEISFAGSKCGR